jgi:hypothetical protein
MKLTPSLTNENCMHSGTGNAEHLGNLLLCHGALQRPDGLGVPHRDLRTSSATSVFDRCNDFEMVGVGATSVSTNVVKLHSCRDRTVSPFPEQNVGSYESLLLTIPRLAVAIRLERSPLPTRGGKASIHNVVVRAARATRSMAKDVLLGVSLNPALGGVGSVGYRSRQATATHAKTGRIGRLRGIIRVHLGPPSWLPFPGLFAQMRGFSLPELYQIGAAK